LNSQKYQTITYDIKATKKSRPGIKDIIHIAVKVLAVAATSIPILLFYLEQRSEIDPQKTLLEFQTYLDLNIELHIILDNAEALLFSKKFNEQW
jgi:hypothetical protein